MPDMIQHLEILSTGEILADGEPFPFFVAEDSVTITPGGSTCITTATLTFFANRVTVHPTLGAT